MSAEIICDLPDNPTVHSSHGFNQCFLKYFSLLYYILHNKSSDIWVKITVTAWFIILLFRDNVFLIFRQNYIIAVIASMVTM